MRRRIQETDWSLLIGKEIIQVCIGSHQVQLHFTFDVSLAIESDFELSPPREIFQLSQNLAMKSCALVRLLEATVINVAAEQERALVISFDNEDKLRILVAGDGYESFVLAAPGSTIVI